jgi:hypothetical protein
VYDELPAETLVWLDKGRQMPPGAIVEKFALSRVLAYRDVVPDAGELPRERLEALKALRASLSPQSADWHGPTTRDADPVWADYIAERARQTDGWGLIVVGAVHASVRDGSLRQILTSRGFECVEAYICPFRTA